MLIIVHLFKSRHSSAWVGILERLWQVVSTFDIYILPRFEKWESNQQFFAGFTTAQAPHSLSQSTPCSQILLTRGMLRCINSRSTSESSPLVYLYFPLDMTYISTGWHIPNSWGRRRSFCQPGPACSYNCLSLCWTHHDWGGVLRKIWVSWKQGRLGTWERFDRWKMWFI